MYFQDLMSFSVTFSVISITMISIVVITVVVIFMISVSQRLLGFPFISFVIFYFMASVIGIRS